MGPKTLSEYYDAEGKAFKKMKQPGCQFTSLYSTVGRESSGQQKMQLFRTLYSAVADKIWYNTCVEIWVSLLESTNSAHCAEDKSLFCAALLTRLQPIAEL